MFKYKFFRFIGTYRWIFFPTEKKQHHSTEFRNDALHDFLDIEILINRVNV